MRGNRTEEIADESAEWTGQKTEEWAMDEETKTMGEPGEVGLTLTAHGLQEREGGGPPG